MKPHRLDLAMGWRAGVAAALAVGGLLVAPSTGSNLATSAVATTEQPAPPVRLIVGTDAAQVDDVGRAAVRYGGRVVATQQALGTVVVDVPAATANRLHGVSAVRSVTPDGQVRLQGTRYGRDTTDGSMANVAKLTGATTYWDNGYGGQGVDVALLDSGVLPVQGLTAANKLVIGPDLSIEWKQSNVANLDTFGHGTHMAGIIGGRDESASLDRYRYDKRFRGIAPESRIVSLKLADAQGRTTVSQVLAAIDWVVTHAHDDGMNIRVLNLSFAADIPSGDLDPLAFAAEVAWSKGIVVVAAAGNGRSDTIKGLASPAYSPAAIAVGSVDTRGTADYRDDRVASWSQGGDDLAHKRGPDLLAPGSSIVSLRAKGSYIDTTYGAAGVVDERFFRGSGTSQSTAIVSGAAALLLSQRPELSPDQVRDILRRSARRVAEAHDDDQGSGSLNLATAYSTPTRAVVPTPAAVAAGSTWDRLTAAQKAQLRKHLGLPDPVAGGWLGSPLAGATWAGDRWAGATWAGATWAGATWAGATWAGATWAGDRWAGATWAGATWAGATWAGATWASADWE